MLDSLYVNQAPKQITLWEPSEIAQGPDIARLGTFQDCLRAPIHRWFKYPAGFSYKLVEAFIDELNLTGEHWILDPFAGCGTVNVVAKQRGVNAVGVEAHPFVHWVATVKCFWEFDMARLHQKTLELIQAVRHPAPDALEAQDLSEFPLLLHKCFSEANLQRLRFIRETIRSFDLTSQERDLFLLALADTLRTATKAGAGLPYIAPSKYHAKQERDSVTVFCETAWMFVQDLIAVRAAWAKRDVACRILLHDARQLCPIIKEEIDLTLTSPPYLNNYDYADRTRLELYFLGWARSWREITEQIRDRLIVSATSRVRRTDSRTARLSDGLRLAAPAVYEELEAKRIQLSQIRHQKGGKKNYDLMVVGYFNDMFEVLQQVHRVLKPDAPFIMVLGDSAPYGVHIPIDRYLGEIALGIGFRDYAIWPLRRRGEKWRANSQRHHVPLQEVILTLRK